MSQPENLPPAPGPRRTCIEDIGNGQLCGRKHLARGLCSQHYIRRYRIDDRPPLQPKGPPLEYIKISLTKEQLVKLKRHARKRGVRMTEMVRWVVGNWLKTNDPDAEPSQQPPQVSSMT